MERPVFKSGWIHPLDRFPPAKRLEDVIADSNDRGRRKKLNQNYRLRVLTPAEEAVHARRHPEPALGGPVPLPVTIDEDGQYGVRLELLPQPPK